MVTSPNTYFTITQLVKITHVFGHPIRANDSGLLGEIVNVAGHSLRRTAVIEIFENKQDLRLAQAF
jgi:hypothetical protein